MKFVLSQCEGLSRAQLMQYGWISGDHNPIHFDQTAAHKRGLPKLIVHGMYLYCIVFKSIEDFVLKRAPHLKIDTLSSKFGGMTFEGDAFAIELESGGESEHFFPEVPYKVFLKNSKGESNATFVVQFKKAL